MLAQRVAAENALVVVMVLVMTLVPAVVQVIALDQVAKR